MRYTRITLGHVLEDSGNEIAIVVSHKTTQKSGSYYTRPYIADFIAKQTVSRLLEDCQSPEEVGKLRIHDPVCGSGSFLIRSTEIIKNWYDTCNSRIGSTLEEMLQKSTKRDIDIIQENLYAIDYDIQAAEITSVNLMLKAIRKNEKLSVILEKNIIAGNSVIDKNIEEFQEEFQSTQKDMLRKMSHAHDNDMVKTRNYLERIWPLKKAFKWESVFASGFDVII